MSAHHPGRLLPLRIPLEWDVVGAGILGSDILKKSNRGTCFWVLLQIKPVGLQKDVRPWKQQPLQTVQLMWEGQCKFSDAYACFCFKVLEPALAQGEKTIKDTGMLATLVSSCLGSPGLLCWRCLHPLVF